MVLSSDIREALPALQEALEEVARSSVADADSKRHRARFIRAVEALDIVYRLLAQTEVCDPDTSERTVAHHRARAHVDRQFELLCERVVQDLFKLESTKSFDKFLERVVLQLFRLHASVLENSLETDGSQTWDCDWQLSMWRRLLTTCAACEHDAVVTGFPASCAARLLKFKDLAALFLLNIQPLLDAGVDPCLLASLTAACEIGRLDAVEGVTGGYNLTYGSLLSPKLSLPSTVKPTAIYQRALSVLVERGECRDAVLRALGPEKLSSFAAPTEGLLWLVREYDRLGAPDGGLGSAFSQSDLEQRIWIALRLADCARDADLAGHIGGFINLESVNNRLFELLGPEVFTCENLEEFLDALVDLTHTLTPLQTYYYFKKSLMIACVTPPHTSLWLIQFAKILADKTPMVVIPTFHINPSYREDVVLRNLNAEYAMLRQMPKDLPGTEDDCKVDSLITTTQQRCAQLPCFELQLLRRHANAAIRAAATSITEDLGSPEKVLDAREAQQKALSTSWLQIVNGGVRRAIKRIEVSNELFS